VAERVVIYGVLANLARRPAAYVRRVLVIGTTPAAVRLQHLFQTHPHWGAEVTGFIASSSDQREGVDTDGPRLLGTLSDMPVLLDKMVFAEVVVSDGITDSHKVHGLAQACMERGLTFHTLLPMPAVAKGRYHAEVLDHGLYLMSVEVTPQGLLPLIMKRC